MHGLRQNTHASEAHASRRSSHRAPGQLIRVMLALVVFVGAQIPMSGPASALTYPATMGIDGAFTDWTGVLADPENVRADATGAADSDNPAAGADLAQIASTWDTTYLYGYMRINTTVKGKLELRMYVDVDGDGLMGAADKVVIYTYNPIGKFLSGGVASYTPANGAGDPMPGNGAAPAGTVGASTYVANLTSCDISTNRFEMRVPWTALGVTEGSPVTIQSSIIDLGTGRSDNAPVASMRYYGVTLVPSLSSAAALGATATYTHTLTNTGNGTETFNLSLASSLGWTVAVTDGTTGLPVTAVTLARGATSTLIVTVVVPGAATPGTKDVTTLSATCAAKPTATAAVTDSTFAGPISVDPDRTGSMMPGGTMEFAHTITNWSTVSQTLALSAVSATGWTAGVFTTAGVALPTVTLTAGQSMSVLVRVVVPAGATIGSTDITTVKAALQIDPTVFDQASDTTNVRAELSFTPNNTTFSGEGQTVSFQHVITNSSAQIRTFNLTASSTLGWTVRLYDTDGVTQITQASAAGYGGTKIIYVRMTVPLSVPVGSFDVTTVRATHAATGLQAVVTDTTQIRQLVTYGDGSLSSAKTAFSQTDTVWALGTLLSGMTQVRFRWLDSSGTLVFQSANVDVEPGNTAVTSYTLGVNATPGTWTVVLVNAATGAEVARQNIIVSLLPWVSLTMDDADIDFGTLSPGTPSAIHTFAFQVDSNAGCTVSRSVTGAVAQMGLTVTGPALGVAPAGVQSYMDSLQATVPWSTDPGQLLVSISYTAVP